MRAARVAARVALIGKTVDRDEVPQQIEQDGDVNGASPASPIGPIQEKCFL